MPTLARLAGERKDVKLVWLSLVELNREWGTKNCLDLHVFGEKGSEGWGFVSTDHLCEQFGK